MSSSLRPSESLSHAVRRVCRRQAAAALKCLAAARKPESVHEARKGIKKLRAVFRLVRGEIAGADYKKVSQAVRLAAKPMAALRDAQVKRQALATLAGKNARRKFPKVSAALEKNFQVKRRDFERYDFAAVAKLILKKVCQRLDELKLKRSKKAAVEQCLKKSYCCARQAWSTAALAPTPEHLHECRKLGKHFWYQLQFFCAGWPGQTKTLVEELEKLGDELGDDHDLVMLKQFSAEHCGQIPETAELNRLIDVRRKEFAEKYRVRAEKLFGQTPAEICAQLKRDWKLWCS
jgi:CHAD domain-containing protein